MNASNLENIDKIIGRYLKDLEEHIIYRAGEHKKINDSLKADKKGIILIEEYR